MKPALTTHSDYIVKEFNTLLMLSARQEMVPKLGYRSDELLAARQLHLHIADQARGVKTGRKNKTRMNVLRPVTPLEEGGFEYPTFDDTINEMNRIQRAIVLGEE